MSQPLPHNPHPPATPAHQAYKTCLKLEAGPPLVNSSFPPTLICARLLGYLLIYSPTEDGRTAIANEIISCNNDEEKLHELAQFYINHFIRTVSQHEGHTPVPSGYVSRPSFDDLQEKMNCLLVEPPKNYTDAKNGALARDGYRCVITGAVDFISFEQYPDELRPSVNAAHGVNVTNCVHILTPSILQHKPAWAMVCHIGNIHILDELHGNDGHRLENVMTMRVDLRYLFDRLILWLEATNLPNQYMLCATVPDVLFGLPQIVTFTGRNNLPLPDPRYLALHAACANVAHLSDARRYLDTVEEEIVATQVLAEDGTSYKLLARALARIWIKE